MIGTTIDLKTVVKGLCLSNETLERHTTFKIGGCVQNWIEPKDIDDLRNILKEINDGNLNWRVIGNGSNILAGETGLPDVVLNLKNFNGIKTEGDIVKAQAGVNLPELLCFSKRNNLGGLEFLAGIPGTVGGAVKVNTGAHGRYISDVVIDVKIMDSKGDIHIIPREKINFAYRYSDIDSNSIILEAVFGLSKDIRENIENSIKEILAKRKISIPLEPSSGCVFKNPKWISAGSLIDKLGFRGLKIGNAMVSNKHANIIINPGGSKSGDISRLIKYIQDEAYRRAGVKLDLEIEQWGEA